MERIDLRGRILVADDDGPLGRLFQAVLQARGHQVEIVVDGEAARSRITEGRFDLVLVDLTMGPVGGLALLEHARASSPETAVVIVTGNATVESAVAALKKGAHDYLVKPVQNEQLALMTRRVLELRRLGEETRRTGEALQRERSRNASLMRDLERRYALERLGGTGRRMEEVRALVAEVIRADSTVLILGESGTGKSLLARTIHFNSHRAQNPFIETNCALYSEGLLMSELFGHEAGAFTGALKQKKGRLELAQGGTVFLDEVGDLPAAAQIALLRFLQERRFERVGGEETIESDVRVIAATNRDLLERMREGAFREDLFYRLNVVPITLPPLRERAEEIPAIAGRILAACAGRLRRPARLLSQDALETLVAHRWPGNIREMENAIERAILLTHGEVVDARFLPRPDRAASSDGAPPRGPLQAGRVAPAPAGAEAGAGSLLERERDHILRVLDQCRGNKKEAARVLGINRSSLYSKLKRHGIAPSERVEACGVGGRVQRSDTA